MKERNRWTRHLLYGQAAAQFPDWFLLVGIEPESVQYIPRASERSGLAEKDQRGRSNLSAKPLDHSGHPRDR